MLLQIAMPMIVCEACYPYSFCGQDGVLCTGAVVHPTLRAPSIHFAFDKNRRRLFSTRPASQTPHSRYSQHFATMEADGVATGTMRRYSQHFAAMEASSTDTMGYSQHF